MNRKQIAIKTMTILTESMHIADKEGDRRAFFLLLSMLENEIKYLCERKTKHLTGATKLAIVKPVVITKP